mmetsp:Transcript_3709/g.10866  ORF Transcript_3709/g.10866 Transcript_3709/m.10866 type:complete len:205 (+) Transcript_3709:377-991(+)
MVSIGHSVSRTAATNKIGAEMDFTCSIGEYIPTRSAILAGAMFSQAPPFLLGSGGCLRKYSLSSGASNGMSDTEPGGPTMGIYAGGMPTRARSISCNAARLMRTAPCNPLPWGRGIMFRRRFSLPSRCGVWDTTALTEDLSSLASTRAWPPAMLVPQSPRRLASTSRPSPSGERTKATARRQSSRCRQGSTRLRIAPSEEPKPR